jgi:hypothetical protein
VNEEDEDNFAIGLATAICEEDCIVFGWTFSDLHTLFAHEPMLGKLLIVIVTTIIDVYDW